MAPLGFGRLTPPRAQPRGAGAPRWCAKRENMRGPTNSLPLIRGRVCRGIDRTPPLQRSHALSGRLARTCVANRGAEGTVTCRADAVGYPLFFRCNG